LKGIEVSEPAVALLIAAIIIAMMSLIFWPNRGLLASWKSIKNTNLRVLMEDALKHIYQYQRDGISCTFDSLAGALEIKTDRVTRILTLLEKLSLVIRNGTGFILTASGEDYALRIIRVHRLWERYLAEETSLPETEWHREAEIQEHKFTAEQANAISHRLGHPRYDPHGDPIPTSAGYLPPRRGIPLTKLQEGDVAKIIHIEDEPATIYSDVIRKGIHLGMQVNITSVSKAHIHFLLDGKSTDLTPLVAANITVVPSIEKEVVEAPHKTLLSLTSGEKAEVISISRACRGQQRRRLMDLGLVPGTIISKEMQSISGDPIAYNIRGAIIALRNEQAKYIYVKALKEVM
jgi:DtxR family Mn-dependent transcriptional regulator